MFKLQISAHVPVPDVWERECLAPSGLVYKIQLLKSRLDRWPWVSNQRLAWGEPQIDKTDMLRYLHMSAKRDPLWRNRRGARKVPPHPVPFLLNMRFSSPRSL